MSSEAIELTRRFIDAFNARDVEAARDMAANGAEFIDAEGNALKGFDGADELLAVAARLNVRLGVVGDEEAAELEDEIRVRVPVRITGAEAGEEHGTAFVAIREGRISEFRVEQAG
jgi:hypothetical protein